MNSEKSIFEEHVGKILATLLATFIIGTISMIYSSDKSSAILALKIETLSKGMEELKGKFSAATLNRWTRIDQASYSTSMHERLKRLEKRIEKLEDR